ncbi:MAG: hypothetical protein ACPGUU_01425 [Flavobacteriaceae bacterium]
MKIQDYKIKDWDDIETGILLDENNDWILIKSNPVDFQIDGYKLINKKHIQEILPNPQAEILNKVFTLKKEVVQIPDSFEFTSTIGFLKWIEKKYGCFEFQDEIENELFYGVLNQINDKSFYIDMVKSDGSLDEDFDVEFFIDDIRILTFESDYFNSISLLFKHNNS